MRWTKKMLSPCVVGLLLVIASPINGQLSQIASKENLDLPFDAFGISEDEKEAPEVVFFYGQQYEGDGFFFCLDRSSSTAKGLMKSLKYADRSSAKRNVVIYLGDGGTTCPNNDATAYGQQTLSQVTGANFKRHQINSICVGTDLTNNDKTFCQTLSRMNGGSYKHIPK